ncbi:MAG TPA: hypothetical protein VK877_05275 [Pseudolabrys sp.]|jgi:hypothetical protein|nr:hypothetical protein [Pseudolabrys sp.]
MPVMPRRGLLAIAAVIDVAAHARPSGIGEDNRRTELGRNGDQISADDILQAASAAGDIGEPLPGSALVNEVVRQALAETERMFSAALDRIIISDLIKLAEALK